MNKPVNLLLQKEMSRQEFLTTLGFGVASIFGFSTIIKLFSGKTLDSHLNHHVSVGYGSSPYGGNKQS